MRPLQGGEACRSKGAPWLQCYVQCANVLMWPTSRTPHLLVCTCDGHPSMPLMTTQRYLVSFERLFWFWYRKPAQPKERLQQSLKGDAHCGKMFRWQRQTSVGGITVMPYELRKLNLMQESAMCIAVICVAAMWCTKLQDKLPTRTHWRRYVDSSTAHSHMFVLTVVGKMAYLSIGLLARLSACLSVLCIITPEGDLVAQFESVCVCVCFFHIFWAKEEILVNNKRCA